MEPIRTYTIDKNELQRLTMFRLGDLLESAGAYKSNIAKGRDIAYNQEYLNKQLRSAKDLLNKIKIFAGPMLSEREIRAIVEDLSKRMRLTADERDYLLKAKTEPPVYVPTVTKGTLEQLERKRR